MRWLLWSAFGPESWPFWLIIVSAAAAMFGRRRILRMSLMLNAAIVVLFGVLPTGQLLAGRLERSYATATTVPNVAHIVVLAGAERLQSSQASGRLEVNSHAERVMEGLALARALPAAKLWIVGGISRGMPRRDVDWTADYWRRAGMSPSRIGIIGDTSDTCTNARGVAETIPDEPVLLVTSALHMPRAMACFRSGGVDALPYPVDRETGETLRWRATFGEKFFLTDRALHEYIGLAYYRLTGRI